jgi:hypothetical protein
MLTFKENLCKSVKSLESGRGFLFKKDREKYLHFECKEMCCGEDLNMFLFPQSDCGYAITEEELFFSYLFCEECIFCHKVNKKDIIQCTNCKKEIIKKTINDDLRCVTCIWLKNQPIPEKILTCVPCEMDPLPSHTRKYQKFTFLCGNEEKSFISEEHFIDNFQFKIFLERTGRLEKFIKQRTPQNDPIQPQNDPIQPIVNTKERNDPIQPIVNTKERNDLQMISNNKNKSHWKSAKKKTKKKKKTKEEPMISSKIKDERKQQMPFGWDPIKKNQK